MPSLKRELKQIKAFESLEQETFLNLLRTAGSRDELQEVWGLLVDLHQRRRRSLGEKGAFASQRFAAFRFVDVMLCLKRPPAAPYE